MSKKKSQPKRKSKPTKSIPTKKNPQDSTLRNTRASNNKLQELSQDIKELKEVLGSSHNKYERQQKVKEVLVKSGLDSQETIKVMAEIQAIVWGS